MTRDSTGVIVFCVVLGVIAGAVFVLSPDAPPQTAATSVATDMAPIPDQVPGQAPDMTSRDAPTSNEIADGVGETATREQATSVEGSGEPASSANTQPSATAPADPDAAVLEQSARQETEASSATEAQADTERQIPAFDLLRVEPDGSTVIAGRAGPGDTLEVLNGSDVIASVEVGPSGDFAAVFEEPLAPGDYQLTLRATDEDAEAVTSEEVATISVPESDPAGLLAMVTRPGEASRIIAQPQIASPALAPSPAPAPQGADTATVTGPVPQDEPAAQSRAAAPSPSGESAAAAIVENGDVSAPPAPTEMPAVTEGPGPSSVGAPSEVESAAVDPAPETPQPAVDQVRIDAVEVEGDRLFVTGTASAGTRIGVYANDEALGEDQTGENGRFLVEGRLALPVGDHTIRADVMRDGQVVARATVPFNRPEGRAVAAVAAPPPVSAPSSPSQAVSPPAAVTAPAPVATPPETAQPNPTDEAPAAQERPTDRLAPSSPSPSAAPATRPQPGAEQPAELAVRGDRPSAAASSNSQDSPTTEAPAPGEALQPDIATAVEAVPPVEAAAPPTLEQAALTPSDSSVIIRRGDTLWQISRRVYGQGVRYTTIYLANEAQISNPDRILPGQVFSVPDDALDNAEELHRERLRNLRGG